jgi:hypothetical protein
MNAESDLLDHFKLEADIHPDFVLHTSYEGHRTGTRRKQKVEKKWYIWRQLGSGFFGEVRLEVDSPDERLADTRAVKVLDKNRLRAHGIDYKRELTALAKFAKAQVRSALITAQKFRSFSHGCPPSAEPAGRGVGQTFGVV